MELKEAVAQLDKEWEERHAMWNAERAANRPEGGYPEHSFDRLLDEWDQREANPKWYDGLRNRYYRVRRFVIDQLWRHNWTYGLKAFWQRGKRGWAGCDVWNLSNHMAEILPPMLRHLAEHAHGHPCDIFDEHGKSMLFEEEVEVPPRTHAIGALDIDGDAVFDGNFQLWKDTLERMAIGFEAWDALCDKGWRGETEAEKELQRMYEEGFMLFYHNFGGLWD